MKGGLLVLKNLWDLIVLISATEKIGENVLVKSALIVATRCAFYLRGALVTLFDEQAVVFCFQEGWTHSACYLNSQRKS